MTTSPANHQPGTDDRTDEQIVRQALEYFHTAIAKTDAAPDVLAAFNRVLSRSIPELPPYKFLWELSGIGDDWRVDIRPAAQRSPAWIGKGTTIRAACEAAIKKIRE